MTIKNFLTQIFAITLIAASGSCNAANPAPRIVENKGWSPIDPEPSHYYSCPDGYLYNPDTRSCEIIKSPEEKKSDSELSGGEIGGIVAAGSVALGFAALLGAAYLARNKIANLAKQINRRWSDTKSQTSQLAERKATLNQQTANLISVINEANLDEAQKESLSKIVDLNIQTLTAIDERKKEQKATNESLDTTLKTLNKVYKSLEDAINSNDSDHLILALNDMSSALENDRYLNSLRDGDPLKASISNLKKAAQQNVMQRKAAAQTGPEGQPLARTSSIGIQQSVQPSRLRPTAGGPPQVPNHSFSRLKPGAGPNSTALSLNRQGSRSFRIK